MDSTEATRIVKECQDEFMRGTLDPKMIEYLNQQYPQAIPDWIKMKLNLKVKLGKFRRRLRNLLTGQANKSHGTRRFRPGKDKSTLRKGHKALEKLLREYLRSGCDVFMPFAQLIDEVKLSFAM